jgi:hypothetical protein
VAAYPRWIYYPNREAPPTWVTEFISIVEASRQNIDSSVVHEPPLTSDIVLRHLQPGLELGGYSVESSKKRTGKIRRPVLFGEGGVERVAFEVDAVHQELGVLVEVEAGRGAMGNAVYRDLVRSSLIVGAQYLALGVMTEYRYSASSVSQSYRDSKELLDAVFASGRLKFPFEGILLFGY